jgi:nucleoside-diphosphate-sugar epimerase
MARYLITGGAGFIGSNIVETLIKKGERVRVLDNFSTGKRDNVKPFLAQIDLVEGSVASLDDCRRAVKDVDFVLHQGALPSVPKSVELPRETNEANVSGTLNMLVAARDAKVKRFVFAASSSAYGDTPQLPKVETMTPTPKSPYAIQKLTGELYCRVFFEQYGLETVAIRYFNVFGPRQDPSSQYSAVIPKFITAYLKDEEPVIFGDGTQSRDFTFIENVVYANLLACTADKKAAGHVMNVACGERITLLELAKVVRDELGKTKTPRHEPMRAGDVMHSHADIARARALLGFQPQVLFKDGMKRTIEWYKSNRAYW